MKDYNIDIYLAEINAIVDDLGGQINLIGLCQGGWMAAMFAARYPHKVATLVAAGAPLDCDAGDAKEPRIPLAMRTTRWLQGGEARGFSSSRWRRWRQARSKTARPPRCRNGS